MQTQEFFQDPDFEGLDPASRLAFVHLTTTTAAAAAPPSTSSDVAPSNAAATTAFFSEQQCTTYGNSLKRRSPSFPSEPKPKKLMVQEDDDHHHRYSSLGFTKIDLPISFPTATTLNPPPSSLVLRRSFSDVCNNAGTSPPDSVSGSNAFFMNNNPQSPENSTVKLLGVNSSTTTPSPTRGMSVSSLLPLPPVLVRSISDPTPSASLFPVSGPVLTRNNSRSSSSGEMGVGFSLPLDSIKDGSPNSKRLRRMKDRMKEMNQWLDEVMREEEDDVSDDNNSTPKQDALSLDTGAEEVSVERLGECLSVKFKCPCGTGYQILLSGKHCYYKLL